MNTIAIDCGASFIKAALISEDGIIITQQQHQTPVMHGEQDVLEPVQIRSLFSAVEAMIEELAKNEKEVKLCISNEMHGFILSHENGMPYTDYLSWQTDYGSVEIDGISAIDSLGREKYRDEILKSGMPLRSGLPSCNLLYLQKRGGVEECKKQIVFLYAGRLYCPKIC